MVHNALGNALMKKRKFSEAAVAYAQELGNNPQSCETINNLGTALHQLGKPEQAMLCYQKAISLNPSYTEAYNNLGVTCTGQGRLDEAITYFRQAILKSPLSADAYSHLGNTLRLQGEFHQAIEQCKQAIERQPNHGAAHLHLGNAYRGLGLFQEAVTSYQQALSLTTNQSAIYSNLAETFKDQGKLKQAYETFEKAVAATPVYPPAYSNLLYFCAFTRYVTPANERALAQVWENTALTGSERATARERARLGTGAFARKPRVERKLRLGILTAELCTHAVAEFLEPILEALDRDRFDLVLFPTLVMSGARAQRLREIAAQAGDRIVSVSGLPALEAAARIRSQHIDVLIETTGHTYNNRLDVIAHRAAPVQCTYIGYWSTTGLTEMDWFLTGTGVPAFIDPHFTERLWRLPRLAFCYKGDPSLPETGWVPDPDGTVWLGSFNNNAKIREETLSLWAKVLQALPEAKLLFESRQVQDEQTQRRIRTTLLNHGIAESRIRFIPYVGGHERHMQLYHQLDIALDTIPFNSVTTAYDTLWMGLPLITLAGNWMGGIMTGCIVAALGYPDWIAQTEEEFVSIVVSLARDLEKRKHLRKTQRSRMASGELCDARGMTTSLEQACEAMYDHWIQTQSNN
jgi:predicted O-linked N-acetylglucosamine transferase (SPINDLY family)